MNKIKQEELPIILGEKVKLRPITIEDTVMIVKWRNAQEVQKNFIFREPFTEEMHMNWMKTKVANGDVIQYIIEDSASEKPVGSVYFRDINYFYDSAEYGIFIGESFARGNGLGSETFKLFTDFGMNILGLHRISVRVLTENVISYKSCLNAGFQKEGCFKDMVKLDGKYRDVIFMAIVSK